MGTSSRDEIEEREIKSLLKASDELKCKNLLVITWDYEGEERYGRRKVKFCRCGSGCSLFLRTFLERSDRL